MTSEHDINQSLDELRQRNPLTVFAALVFGTLVLAFAVNILSTALYDAWLTFWTWLFPKASSEMLRLICLGPIIVLAVVLLGLSAWYVLQLSNRQNPSVRRVIKLVLPFKQTKSGILLEQLKHLYIHQGKQHRLNMVVTKAGKANDSISWETGWQFDVPSTPITDDAVTIVYDLVEFMVLDEVANYGNHVYEGKGNIRPGDDFLEIPTGFERRPLKDLYIGRRPNFILRYDPQTDDMVLKLPVETTVSLHDLPRRYGVLEHGKEAVRQIVIRNPAGVCRIMPSQIWRRVQNHQARRVLNGYLGENNKQRVDLDIRLAVDVQFRQWPFITPWPKKSLLFYQHWLLELQEQMVRHMDFDRFIASDYDRKVIETWRAVQARTEPASPEPPP